MLSIVRVLFHLWSSQSHRTSLIGCEKQSVPDDLLQVKAKGKVDVDHDPLEEPSTCTKTRVNDVRKSLY